MPALEPLGPAGDDLPGLSLFRSAAPDAGTVSQLDKLEKKLFKKSDALNGAFMGRDMAQLVKRRNTFTFLAREEDGSIAGYLMCTLSSLVVHVTKLAVAPPWRRRGLGRRLVDDALTFGRTRRCSDATLHVEMGNTPALGLYRSLGFEVEKELIDYYSPGRGAYLMRLDLDR